MSRGLEGGPEPVPEILAVDDVPANLFALTAVLEPLGARIVTASSGPEAIERAAAGGFAAILLDIAMPGMDGFETLERIRALPAAHHIPVILVTAYDLDPHAIERAYRLGAVDYARKPISPELLRGKVAALLALHRSTIELQRRGDALDTKDRHIAILAHDLQNPLSAIFTSAQMLTRAEIDPRSRSNADRILRAAHRMTTMIRNLTDYARAGHGPIPIDRSPMDLGELCREVVTDFGVQNPGRAIELVCKGDLNGEWDRNRLHRALANLLGNALKYGEGSVRVHAEGSDVVEVVVQNDGPPIPADLIPVIFQPFQRGGEGGEGLGLGLFIVREIVGAHAGTATVESSAGAGTTFRLRLPRAARAASADPAHETTHIPAT
jgi:two-component system sensor histidine kinase/response regulator